MHIIRFAELKAQPWRNGGGVTREVLALPAAPSATPPKDKSSDDWDWRVSIADVTHDGEFSLFPGMERLLTVIDGDSLVMTGKGWEQRLERYRTFRFSGDATVHGELPSGGIRDLNVITRAGNFKAFTLITDLRQKHAHPILNGQLGILLQGQASVTYHAEELEALSQCDTVVGSDEETLEIVGHGVLAVVSIQATLPLTSKSR